MNIEALILRMLEDGISENIVAYVALHAQSGCRISDLLAVDYRSISKHLNISILQGKGSMALVIQPLYFRDYWQIVRDAKLTPMASFNRFYFYRLYKKYGIVSHSPGSVNNSVTHAFRFKLAQDIQSIDNNKDRVQGALGHKSKKSTQHYYNSNIEPNVID